MTPPIVTAAQSPNLYAAALAYADLSLSVMPTRGKISALAKWEERQERRASRAMITYWANNGLLQNLAIVCGKVSSNLVVMDLDGMAAVEAFRLQFPGLVATYTVRSGSGHGAHLYFYSETLPPTTRVVSAEIGNVELRANGCYVVAPPSIHPVSQSPYTVMRPLPIMRISHMYDVVEWVKALIREKHGGNMPPPTNARQQPVGSTSAWANAALDAECRAVKFAPKGARNDTLNRAAFKMGQLVAKGKLDRYNVEQALFNAAADLTSADGDRATLATIKSGVEAGITQSPKTKSREGLA